MKTGTRFLILGGGFGGIYTALRRRVRGGRDDRRDERLRARGAPPPHVEACLRVPGHPGVWAVGDAASVPDGKVGFHPSTASIGRRTGVARILGVNFSGFFAWWMWRTIYLSKLPSFEKKLRVALDWTLDLFFSKDLVQYLDVNEMKPAAKPKPVLEAAHPLGHGR